MTNKTNNEETKDRFNFSWYDSDNNDNDNDDNGCKCFSKQRYQ